MLSSAGRSRCLIAHQLDDNNMFLIVNPRSAITDNLHSFLQPFAFEDLAKIRSEEAAVNLGMSGRTKCVKTLIL